MTEKREHHTMTKVIISYDGTDNDQIPAAPANIKSDNTIAVAATLDRVRLASFSNFGESMVDIAAPGVGIKSLIPGGQEVQLSGTSQAAPYITNIAFGGPEMRTAYITSSGRGLLYETEWARPGLRLNQASAPV